MNNSLIKLAISGLSSLLFVIASLVVITTIGDLAALPTKRLTVQNSYLILMIVQLASLVTFTWLHRHFSSYVDNQMIWIFLSFMLLAYLSMTVLRLDYSNMILVIGWPIVLVALTYHQNQARRHLHMPLYLLNNSGDQERVTALGLSVTMIDHQAITKITTPGILLLSSDDLTSDQMPFDASASSKLRLISIERFMEDYEGRVRHFNLETVEKGHATRQLYQPFKRLSDILFSLSLLSLSLPLMVVIYAFIRLTSPGPAIFSQSRAGLNGKAFTIYKFRTMHLASEKQGQQFASLNDPRIIKGGHFMRRARFDELPQLWNVLKGDMSLIGPRPEQTNLNEALCAEIPHFAMRQMVRPGITGWAQVIQGYADDKNSSVIKLSYDLYYIKHYGPLIDLLVIIRTLTTIFTGFGSR